MSSVTVRTARNADLGAIHQLMHDSFMALLAFTGEEMRPHLEGAVKSLKEHDLKDLNETYLDFPDRHFWVAEVADKVVGCVGVKRISLQEAELVRMAVDKDARSQGIGSQLVPALVEFCRSKGFSRISLTTGNPLSARFYEKNGFVTAKKTSFRRPPQEQEMTSFFQVKYIGANLIRNVTIAGGTHGNELLGVHLARHWLKDPTAVSRSTFKTRVLLSNEEAIRLNRRYKDTDLNRAFVLDSDNTTLKHDPACPDAYERERARQLNAELGPKSTHGNDCATDFFIDLHSTTSNFGLAAILNDDVFALKIAHKVQQRFPEMKLCGGTFKKNETPSIDSIARSGLAYEVGPQAHGTMKASLLEATRNLVTATLDAIEEYNLRLIAAANGKVTSVPGKNEEYVLAEDAPEAVVPQLPCEELTFFEWSNRVDYPRNEKGEVTAVFHPSQEGKDFERVIEGEPLFQDIGTGEVIPFKAPEVAQQMWGPIRPCEWYAVFVNEAAYYEKGIAMSLALKQTRLAYL